MVNIGNSTLNNANLLQQLQDIKENSKKVANSMKEELRQELQAFYMGQQESQFWGSPVQDIQLEAQDQDPQMNNMLAIQQQ